MRPSLFAADGDDSSKRALLLEGRRDRLRRIGDAWRRPGMSGEASGTSGVERSSLARTYTVAAIVTDAACTIDVIDGVPRTGRRLVLDAGANVAQYSRDVLLPATQRFNADCKAARRARN